MDDAYSRMNKRASSEVFAWLLIAGAVAGPPPYCDGDTVSHVQMMERKRLALEQKWVTEQQEMQRLQEEGWRARRGDRACARSSDGECSKFRSSVLEGYGAAGIAHLAAP